MEKNIDYSAGTECGWPPNRVVAEPAYVPNRVVVESALAPYGAGDDLRLLAEELKRDGVLKLDANGNTVVDVTGIPDAVKVDVTSDAYKTFKHYAVLWGTGRMEYPFEVHDRNPLCLNYFGVPSK